MVSDTRHVTDRRQLHRLRIAPAAGGCSCSRAHVPIQRCLKTGNRIAESGNPGEDLSVSLPKKTFFRFSRSRRDRVRRILREKLSARRNGRDHVDQDTIWILRDEMALAERFVLQGQKNG